MTSTPYGVRASSALTPIQIQRMEAESGNEQMMQLIPDRSYLQERADQMSQVEENIVELGMFSYYSILGLLFPDDFCDDMLCCVFYLIIHLLRSLANRDYF